MTYRVVNGFSFGDDLQKNFLFVVLGLAALSVLVVPVLTFLSLPVKGFGGFVWLFVLTAILLYVFPSIIPGFSIEPTTLGELIIFGFVLPSKALTVSWSLVASALFFSFMYRFFCWLCPDKK